MLPSTLLLESIHSKDLSRKQRIEYLTIGASLMIHYEYSKKIIKQISEDDCDTDICVIPNKRLCFTTKWSSEYISLTLSIVSLLYNEKNVNLGACGTHILEHYFGAIRRHSGGDNTHDRFLKSMRKVFLEQYLLNDLEIPREHPRRRSDSGYNVTDELIVEKNNLMHYLQITRGLIHTFMNIPEHLCIYDFALPKEPVTIKAFAKRYLQIETKSENFFFTKTGGITATGGLGNVRIWSAANQLVKLTRCEGE
jgi:hypothetical protein